MQAQRADLKWNSKGTHLLGHTSCDFDATNQSYFGESRLYLLTANDRINMQVTMDNEATMISDCAWSPDGNFFVALGGISPTTAVLFDTKGDAVYQLAQGPYNQICWNPQSRFVLLAGFGNMPGDIRLFEKKADNACKPMGGCKCAPISPALRLACLRLCMCLQLCNEHCSRQVHSVTTHHVVGLHLHVSIR
jgi:translation initiation factor 2A